MAMPKQRSSGIAKETAAQMFARLNPKPWLHINMPIFDEVLKPGSIYEIQGPSGSGKSSVLYELLCKFLLPSCSDGLEIGVVFIDNDRRLNLSRLADLLRMSTLRSSPAINDDSSPNKIVRESLHRLSYVTCDDSPEFLHSLEHVELMVHRNRKAVSALIIDGISAFVYFDKVDENFTFEEQPAKLRNMHKVYGQKLKRLASELNLVVIVTQQTLTCRSQIKKPVDAAAIDNDATTTLLSLMDKSWRNIVTSTIRMENTETPNVFYVKTVKGEDQTLCKFVLEQSGVKVIL